LTAQEFDVSLKKAKFDNCDSLTAFAAIFCSGCYKNAMPFATANFDDCFIAPFAQRSTCFSLMLI
jgi:hypothetical protein